jgi:hypothetical protein
MKITIKKEIEETHELELPAYRKNSCHYYKILNETTSIVVCTLDKYEAISRSTAASALRLAPLESNKEEFDVKFNEVFTLISEKVS